MSKDRRYRTQGRDLLVTLWGALWRQVRVGDRLREGDIFRGNGNRWYRTGQVGDTVGRETNLEVYYRKVPR